MVVVTGGIGSGPPAYPPGMSGPNAPSLPQGNPLARFAAGFRFPFAGVRHVVAHPRLWPYAVVPAFLTVVMIGGAVWLAWTRSPELTGTLLTPPGVDAARLAVFGWTLAMIAVGLVTFVVGAVLCYALGTLIAVPFNDFLSQAVEESVLGSRNEPFTMGLFLSDLRMSLGHSLLGVLAWLTAMVPVVLLNLVPVAGTLLASGLGALVTATFLAREMLDGPLSRDRLPFGVKLEVLKRDKVLTLGFGAGTAALLWVPGLNLVSMPCAVVGGTLLYCQLKRDGRLPEPRQRR